ncbi:energy transducer TonB [Kaistella pullorum]|uniref:Energy transducer TonB n=1 Tax=Kaistella pullorum TaxID=2763074 RepID=A0ABR8WKE0_9FLAO|nr:energy transducer TonB [Kaistella pullorum]MBD8017522.1 energy transducer TonB [Kaistella pullorum]
MKKILIMFLFLSSAVAFAQISAENVGEVAAQENVGKPAEFPGGINEFRNLLMKNFRSEKLKIDKGIVNTTVTFVINTDGSVSDIKASGENQVMNDESVRAVSKIKTKWIPAELNGEKVKYNFTMPFTLSF